MSLLGQRLCVEREKRGLALLQVELDTRIRANIIEALERGEYDNLPPEPFLRGLIRSYANYLRVDPQELLDLYAADTAPAPAPPPRSTRNPRPVAESRPPLLRPDPQPPAKRDVSDQRPSFSRNTARSDMSYSSDASNPTDLAHPSDGLRSERGTETKGMRGEEPPSMPEPVVRPRRRLPLAPPSPKPKTPLLPAVPIAPPSLPPETLPPPEPFVVTDATPLAPSEKGNSNASDAPHPKDVVHPKDVLHPRLPIQLPRVSIRLPHISIKVPSRLAHLPKPALIGGAAAVVLIVLALAYLALIQIAPTISAIAAKPTATPTRRASTSTPTIVPGTAPTGIPTIPATAPPFTAVPIVPTATATVKRTVETGSSVLNLDIHAMQPITVQVGVDGVMLYNGPMAAGDVQSWSAKEALYVRVENFVGATVTVNTKKQLPLNFAERSVFERQWVVDSKGRVAGATPQPPSAATPIRVISSPLLTTPTPTNTPLTPTATKTPY